MKRLYLKYEDGGKDLAEDILIDKIDPDWLIDFTRNKIAEIERNGVTFEAINELYTEFDKVYPENHFFPIEEVHLRPRVTSFGYAEKVSICCPKERQKTQITTFCLD